MGCKWNGLKSKNNLLAHKTEKSWGRLDFSLMDGRTLGSRWWGFWCSSKWSLQLKEAPALSPSLIHIKRHTVWLKWQIVTVLTCPDSPRCKYSWMRVTVSSFECLGMSGNQFLLCIPAWPAVELKQCPQDLNSAVLALTSVCKKLQDACSSISASVRLSLQGDIFLVFLFVLWSFLIGHASVSLNQSWHAAVNWCADWLGLKSHDSSGGGVGCYPGSWHESEGMMNAQ